jgi:hypothetical protein
VGQSALFRVEAALTVLVLPAGDHIEHVREKNRVESAAADLNYLTLFKHVEGLDTSRCLTSHFFAGF